MKVAIIQPAFLPWLGFFNMMANSDVFVLFNDVQFVKRTWTNRNYIKNSIGAKQLLSVPVNSKGNYKTLIHQIERKPSSLAIEKMIHTMIHSYAQAPYFKTYFDSLETLLLSNVVSLASFNEDIIRYCKDQLGIKSKLMHSSDLDYNRTGSATEKLVSICEILKATSYINGPSGKDYMTLEQFRNAKIEFQWHHYKHPEYPQINGNFVPYLSIIDLLMNVGPNAYQILFQDQYKK